MQKSGTLGLLRLGGVLSGSAMADSFGGRLKECVRFLSRRRLALDSKLFQLLVLTILLSLYGTSSIAHAQTLESDDSSPPNGRVPLILIHGWCGSPQGTWDHDGNLNGFADYFRSSSSLNARFKLYYFKYPTETDFVPLIDVQLCSNPGSTDHTWQRVKSLAADLGLQLVNNPDIGSQQPVAFVAHSLGGLIARSYLQELLGYRRTTVLITLATPHHGTLRANNYDGYEIGGQEGDLSSLYWDTYDGAFEPPNNWLRCLNGLDPTNGYCLSEDFETRHQTFPKIVAVGVARPSTLSQSYPDDGIIGFEVVPIQSALFDDSEVWLRSRYRGTAGFEFGSNCQGKIIPHIAVHYTDCFVEEEPSWGHGLRDVFTIIRGELLAAVSAPESPLTMSITATPDPVKPSEQIIYNYTVQTTEPLTLT